MNMRTQKKIPIIPLLHKTPNNIARGKTDVDPSAWEKLEEFRKKVELHHTCGYWETPNELKSQVIISLTSMFRRHPGVGWVRAGELSSYETSKEILKLKGEFNKAIRFISGLEHCTKFCADREDSWSFGDEYELVKGRDQILNKFGEIVGGAEPNSEIMFISAGFNLTADAWKILLKRIDEISFKVIINEDGVDNDAHKLLNIISKYTDPRCVDTFGIRLLLVKDKEGYFCNSKSVAKGAGSDSYWSIYSKHPSTLKIMEIVFNYLWNDTTISE